MMKNNSLLMLEKIMLMFVERDAKIKKQKAEEPNIKEKQNTEKNKD